MKTQNHMVKQIVVLDIILHSTVRFGQLLQQNTRECHVAQHHTSVKLAVFGKYEHKMDKAESALQLSEEVLTGIETESINTSTVALRCLRLARLISDTAAIEWFQYETTGYPQTPDKRAENHAFTVACAHGRELISTADGEQQIFPELSIELEANIQTLQNAVGTMTTQGVSVTGDSSLSAMRELMLNVVTYTEASRKAIQKAQRLLAILRGKYYDYALSINLELKFSQRAEEIFRSYRLSVDKLLAKLAPESLKKLDAVYERLSSTHPESWVQAVTSCRRVVQEVSDALFTGSKEGTYETKSGKVLDISGDHYLNRLFASVDILSSSSTSRRLVGSNVLYVVDLIDNLHNVLNRGIHDLDDKLTYEEARAAILHTYMLLGDVATVALGEK
ncbi:MAG: hypothetical protein NTZ04_04215 [Chloroflexi bacterium]|nr:hypothetical protein [Chloroflexota bacterium]